MRRRTGRGYALAIHLAFPVRVIAFTAGAWHRAAPRSRRPRAGVTRRGGRRGLPGWQRRRGVLGGANGSTPATASLLDRGASMFARLRETQWVAPVASAEPAVPPIEEHALRRLRPQPLRSALADVCSVCLEPLCAGDPAISLKCRHTFHGKCLLPWLLRCASCPMCKVAVRL